MIWTIAGGIVLGVVALALLPVVFVVLVWALMPIGLGFAGFALGATISPETALVAGGLGFLIGCVLDAKAFLD